MNVSLNLHEQQRRRIRALIVATGIAVILVSGIGVLALTGAVPASKPIPVIGNASLFIDTPIADPLSGLKAITQSKHGLAVTESTRASGVR
ncbi:hypothetical protein ASG35_18800 [Burkholderia sp. Leaf177]|uniref:hypothetical protein n=1 Tax=Burkholderia sp. Leaf177 TaxID=1736287 RepID=UPI000700C1A3|nr:hypothetical protein [Burkholderia sp. Leaf177]KQR74766.1 hypothetical protein ASG35_18800 [Burkholderia sp. Leaf177]